MKRWTHALSTFASVLAEVVEKEELASDVIVWLEPLAFWRDFYGFCIRAERCCGKTMKRVCRNMPVAFEDFERFQGGERAFFNERIYSILVEVGALVHCGQNVDRWRELTEEEPGG